MRIHLAAAALAAAAFAAGCAQMTGAKDVRTDIEAQETSVDSDTQESDARTSLGSIENALAEYIKSEQAIPADLDELVPKYLADIPPLDITACGRRTQGVQKYPSTILRGGRVDGARIKGTGLWGYVHDSQRVVIFVDCLKPAANGTPWYQVRGIY
ncbi:MAG: hypothetical protein HKL90_09975 [Elusimicrobia bacterium]|nr:hypothetical protein [Elusimicrobiota bacterium]